MRLPTPLLRRKADAYKNQFGHVLILAGSSRTLGAAALSGLAAMRSGAGLVTVGVPQSLNGSLQKKMAPVIMTWPLKETPGQSLSRLAFSQIKKEWSAYQAVGLGPGLSRDPSTQRLVLKIIEHLPLPLVVDADGLNALAGHLDILKTRKQVTILTPHPGEMARLTGLTKKNVEENRRAVAVAFAQKHGCILLLKGHRTLICTPDGKCTINRTGNAGMSTAGSGDVLTGMITALLGQGVAGNEAARFAAFWHGKAGDTAVRSTGKAGLIATDLIESLPKALKNIQKNEKPSIQNNPGDRRGRVYRQ